MLLKFSYWGKESPYYTEPYIVKHWYPKEVGSKLVGCTLHGGRPYEVTLNKEELQYLIDNPKYIKHLYGALRDDNGPIGVQERVE